MFKTADRIDRRAAGRTDKAFEVAELRRRGGSYDAIAEHMSIAMHAFAKDARQPKAEIDFADAKTRLDAE